MALGAAVGDRMDQLRLELGKMTLLKVDTHREALASLTTTHANGVRIVESEHEIGRYTCLMHAFGLTAVPAYVEIAELGYSGVFAGAEFATWLLENGHLHEIAGEQVRPGDLVVYFRSEMFKHVGIVGKNGAVISKWGRGHLYEHGLFEVPEAYGELVRWYASMPRERALGLFLQYAAHKGVRPTNLDGD